MENTACHATCRQCMKWKEGSQGTAYFSRVVSYSRNMFMKSTTEFGQEAAEKASSEIGERGVEPEAAEAQVAD